MGFSLEKISDIFPAAAQFISKSDASQEKYGETHSEQIKGRIVVIAKAAFLALVFAGAAAFCIHQGSLVLAHGPGTAFIKHLTGGVFIGMGGCAGLVATTLLKEIALQSVAINRENRYQKASTNARTPL